MRPSLLEHVAGGDHGALYPAGPKGFHILGFDVMFTEDYKALLLELNANSSMSVLQPLEPNAVQSEISELDLAVKSELIAQALLVTNPMSHGTSLRRRLAWLEAAGSNFRDWGSCRPAVEPVPLDDHGTPVHGSAALVQARPDSPGKCPALRPLRFKIDPQDTISDSTGILAQVILHHWSGVSALSASCRCTE